MVTEKGTIHAEHVVNAAGLWAKQVARMVGWEAPVSPLAHHYLITEQIPELEAMDFEIPMMIDLEGFTYMRQEINGVLVGIYEIDHKHWNMDGAPWDYGIELLPPDIDRISDELALAMNRYPVLERTASADGSMVRSRSLPTAIRWLARCRGFRTTGLRVRSWPASSKAAAWANRLPSG